VDPFGDRWRSVASLTQWGAVTLAGSLHLVGVLLGGHDRLPSGIWMVSSRVAYLNLRQRLAITSSRGRLYEIHDAQEGPWSEEATDLIGSAMRKWGIRGTVPTDPISAAALADEISRRALDTIGDTSRDLADPLAPDVRHRRCRQ
jgi:hypothetical protein